jgi:hypothetical protein
MTVAELINALQSFDPKLRVVTRGGYEGGYEDAAEPNQLYIALNVHAPSQWYYGPHEDVDDYSVTNKPLGTYTVENAVLIG